MSSSARPRTAADMRHQAERRLDHWHAKTAEQLVRLQCDAASLAALRSIHRHLLARAASHIPEDQVGHAAGAVAGVTPASARSSRARRRARTARTGPALYRPVHALGIKSVEVAAQLHDDIATLSTGVMLLVETLDRLLAGQAELHQVRTLQQLCRHAAGELQRRAVERVGWLGAEAAIAAAKVSSAG